MKYTIVYINDRSKENMNKTKTILSSFEYIDDIEFFDGKKFDVHKSIKELGVKINWCPYDGRTHPPLDGELGLWISNINIFKYMLKNSIGEMLVLEDDAIITEDFNDIFKKIYCELPKKWDFVSLHSNDEQNHQDERTNINLKYLHRTINQYSSTVGMIYSYSGAKKILRSLRKDGIEYTVDCQIFRKSLEDKLNGYSLKKEYAIILHDTNVGSTIDLHGIR